MSECDHTEEMLTETCQLVERRQRTKGRCPASRDRREQEGNDDRRASDEHADPRPAATQQQNAQNGRCQRGDEGGPPNDSGAGLAVHALRSATEDETGKRHQECRERQIGNDRDGAKNLHETPFACIYRPALTWAGHTFDGQGQAALARALLTVTRCQNLHQRCQVSAQARDTMRNQVGHAVGVVRTGSDAVRQVD